MPQVFGKGFLIREPARPPAVAVGAALIGKGLGYAPNLQNPTDDEVGGKKWDGNRGQGRAFGVMEPAYADGFLSPKVLKGRLTNEDTRKTIVFMFNPEQVNRADGWDWGSHGIPGASHPIIAGGSGAGRNITFTLYLDADRGRADKRESFGSVRSPGLDRQAVSSPTSPLSSDEFSPDDPTALDLTSEINFFRRFTYPIAPNQDQIQRRGPATAIFRFGPLFPGVRVAVRRADTTVVAWTPKLEPMRATISIELQEVVSASALASNFHLGLGEKGSSFFDQVTGTRAAG